MIVLVKLHSTEFYSPFFEVLVSGCRYDWLSFFDEGVRELRVVLRVSFRSLVLWDGSTFGLVD